MFIFNSLMPPFEVKALTKKSKAFLFLLVSLLLTILVSCQCMAENPNQPAVNQLPIISNDQRFPISETITSTEVIGQVKASDPEGKVITFSLLTNDVNVIFELTPSGVLSLSNGQSLDYDRMSNHPLVVSVSDGELFNTATVVVEVRSNQAPVFNAQNLNFRVSETLLETEVIGEIEASDPEDRALSYRIEDNTNFFEVTSSGDISLVSGQFLDYERTNRHSLVVSVFDGELSNTATVTVEVEDVSLANGDYYCGDLTEITPTIDGSEHPFFLSGTGASSVSPYVIPVRSDCRDITFIYDPNYTNGSTNIYFVFSNFTEAQYNFRMINVERLLGTEAAAWITIVNTIPQGDNIVNSQGFVNSQGVVESDPPFNNRPNGVIFTAVEINVFGDTASRQWLSKKGFRFQRIE